jgi:hypothetical protein
MSDRDWQVVRADPEGLGAKTPHFRIRCGKCGEVDYVTAAPGTRSQHPTIGKRFRRAGWTVGAKEAGDRCPACSASAAPTAKFPKDLPMIKTTTPGLAVTATTTANPPAVPTPPAAMKITEVYMALSGAYDLAARGYKSGWSDERIARDLSVSVELVAKRREQDFGPVMVDTFGKDLANVDAALRLEVAQLDKLYEAIGERLRQLRSLVDQHGRLTTAYQARAK